MYMYMCVCVCVHVNVCARVRAHKELAQLLRGQRPQNSCPALPCPPPSLPHIQVSGWQGARELHSDHGSVVVYRGMMDCFVRTVREEGFQALFKVRACPQRNAHTVQHLVMAVGGGPPCD